MLLLYEYNIIHDPKWQIHAIHIDPQFPNWDSKSLENLFIKHNFLYMICNKNINKRIENIQDKCFLCARERRSKILETAEKLNIFQIALAHHQEDVAETLLLNMFYTGRVAALLPKQSILRGRFHLIRPLYYFNKKQIRAIADVYGISDMSNTCPYYKYSKRQMIRNFLAEMRKENPDLYHNIFRCIFHINEEYLPVV